MLILLHEQFSYIRFDCFHVFSRQRIHYLSIFMRDLVAAAVEPLLYEDDEVK
jgi:hypothetical protein